MSGLEIAGLVLGVIPIAIETLKMGSQGIAILRRSRRYKNELERLVNKFENGRVRLQDVCEKLLVDLVPHSRIESLVQNPLGLFKDEPELNAKLRRRLWRGFNLFNKTLEEIKTTMDEATERIDVQIQDKSNLRRSLRHSFLDDLLSRINEGISVLEQLVDRGIELEPARKSRFQGKFLCLMCNLANGVFEAVRASFDCPCKHHVCLQLERRIPDIVPDDAENYLAIKETKFHLALSYRSFESNSHAISRKWLEILVKPTAKSIPQASVHTNKSKTKSCFRIAKLHGHPLLSRLYPSPIIDPIKVPDNSVELEPVAKDPEPSPTTLDLCARIRQPVTTASMICYGLLFDASAPKPPTYNAY